MDKEKKIRPTLHVSGSLPCFASKNKSLACLASLAEKKKRKLCFEHFEPLIFTKKQKKDLKVIPLKVKTRDGVQTKHFTPAAQEWINSIYAYNKNYTKLLPVADNNLMSLVKSYFNFYFKAESLRGLSRRKRAAHKSNKKPKGKKMISIRKRSRSRGLSANKIFVAKGDLKHTSSKAVITLYLYNTEKNFLIRKIKKQIFGLYRPNKRLKRYINIDRRNQKEIISYNRPFSVKEYLRIPDHYIDYLTSFNILFMEKLCKYFNLTNKYINLISNLVSTKVLSEDEKLLIFDYKVNSLYSIKYPNYEDYMHKVKLHYLNKLTICIKLLTLNQIKFKHAFLLELKYLVSQIYSKSIEFNLVNLKKMHLNSDIFTQAVTLKLKNRNNKLYRVLKSSLNKVKLPYFSRNKEKSNATGSLSSPLLSLSSPFLSFPLWGSEGIRGDQRESGSEIPLAACMQNKALFTQQKKRRWAEITNDSLNKLLLNIFPLVSGALGAMPNKQQVWDGNLKKESRLSLVKRPISVRNYILRSLKHINMAGIRIEAKGRLTKRFTASRSIFKMKWKGGLKNIDSSFGGLSRVILRGHVKSNIQYSMLHSKNRNGAFGIKGWVSSK
jgi:Mitochondrial ribosomal protein (VAR1)